MAANQSQPAWNSRAGSVAVHHSSIGVDSKDHFAGRTSAKCLLLWYFLGGVYIPRMREKDSTYQYLLV